MSWDPTDPIHCPCCDTHGECVHQGPTRPAHVAWRLGSRAAEDHLWGTCQRGVPTPAELGHEPTSNPYAEESDEHRWWARAWSATYSRIQWQAARFKASCPHPQARAGVCIDCGADLNAPPVPRRPVAGWTGTADRMVLRVGAMRAVAIGTKRPRWDVTRHINARHEAPFSVVDEGDAPTLEAAQLAAEDALLAVLTDAARALGKRVVS